MIKKIKYLFHWLIAYLAYWYYGRPSRQIIVIGVTGTKGKSTTCRFIASVLEAGGFKVGLLTTVEFQIGAKRTLNKNQMTMLGRGRIQKYLKEMVLAGCRYAVIETSSEGILQSRHIGLNYDIAVFTNLGTEHHERHGGVENLKRDKGKMFAALNHYPRKVLLGRTIQKISIINADDPNSDYFLAFPADQKITYSLTKPHHQTSNQHLFVSEISKSTIDETEFWINGACYHIRVPGMFNIYNAMPAIAIGQSQGISSGDISAGGLFKVSEIPGRMQFIEEGQNFLFVVDYAHEAMSFTALFSALRPLVRGEGKLVCIIGSDGGGRDVTKRALMGSIAGEKCDFVVITDVNPWDEDPRAIAEMLANGAREKGKIDNKNLFIIIDRRVAIRRACELAGAGGVVALTAKGTESSIIGPGGQKTPWDDAEAARSELLSCHSESPSQGVKNLSV